ncbi:Endo-1,4-beta-xylanase A precursor [compost metagenome]
MIVSGKGSGMFSPDEDVTRAELAAIIVRGLGLRLEQGESTFSDVKVTDWYSSSIQTAYEYGLINGFEEGTFQPNDKVTREQAMLILSKAMDVTELSGQSGSQTAASILSAFSDTYAVSNWALNGIAESVNAGIISGRSSGLIDPKAYITRAEVAIIVQRLLQKSNLIDE